MAGYVDSTEQLVTEGFVHDITRSVDFYSRLGFELTEDKGDFVALSWEGHQLFLDQRSEGSEDPEFTQANIRVMVPDVDRYWDMAREIGARVLNPIANRGYGLRDFTIADPDGFGLRFATRLSDDR